MPEWDDSEQAWRQLAERAIGRSLDSLRNRTSEGLVFEPRFRPRARETKVACLSGTDDAYGAADGLLAALRASRAHLVLRTGAPAADEPGSESIDAFIHDGCDALAILDRTPCALPNAP